MSETKRSVHIRSYCVQCHSKCPIIGTVKDGKLVKIRQDPDHPRLILHPALRLSDN